MVERFTLSRLFYRARTMFRSARTRLFVLVLLTVIPAVAVQLYGAWSNLQQNLGDRKVEVTRAAAHAQGDFATLLDQAHTVFTDLVRQNEMRNPNNCTLIFGSLRLAYERLAPEATNLGLSDAQGNLYCAVNPVQGERNVAGQPYFQNTVKTLDMAVGAYARNPLTGAVSFTVAYPVTSFEGKVQTVIMAVFEITWLSAWQHEAGLPAGAAYTLLSPENEILSRVVDGAPVAVTTLDGAPAAWLVPLLGEPGGVQMRDLDGALRLHTLVPLALKGQTAAYLQVGFPVAPLYAKAYRALEWELVLLALTTAAAMAIAAVGSESLFLRPLRQVMNVARQVQAGDLAARATGVRGLSELVQLAQAFDRMAGALQQREKARRQAQTELEQSEARFRAMFESSPAGIGIMGLDRKVIDMNPAMCRMFGRGREELLGQTPALVTHPDDYRQSTESFQELLTGQRAYYWDERRYLRKSGEVFWAQITMSVVRDPAGQPLYLVGMLTDISEQRRALAELQESEARFRAVYENAAMGISLIAPDGQVLSVNPVLLKLSGYSEAELIALGGQGITHPDDRDIGRQEFVEVLAGQRDSYQVEKRYVCKDGCTYWMRQSISTVCDPDGKLLYIVAVSEDIDQQKRAVEELRQSEARFRAMFENSALGVVILDADTLTLRANVAARQLLAESSLEQTLTDVHDFISAKYQAAEREPFDDLVSGRRDAYDTEHCYCHPGQPERWAHVTLSAVREAGGQLRYLVAMLEDITERKQAQATLQESEARFRAILDNAAVGVAVMTLDRRIVQVNPTTARLTGYSAEELMTVNPSALAVEADRLVDREMFDDLVAGRRSQYLVEKRYTRKDGTLFWGRVNFALVRDGAGQPLYTIGMIEDITEEKRVAERLAAQEADYRRQLEQRIAERTQELNAANERLRVKAAQDAVTAERTRLARDLHDAVTQTLFSATLIADVLPQLWEMNPAEGLRRLEELHQLNRGALAEMRTLLVELRPNALVEVPLPTLLRQLAEALIGRSRLNIQVHAEGDGAAGGRKLPADVQIGLYRIAQEALNNAVKHAKATQAVVTLRLGETVRLTVADNGMGFDPSAITADHLGLKIMHERADAIQARLTVYSEPGEGTQISVTWA
jgi:PAS domain S-box-containing protein